MISFYIVIQFHPLRHRKSFPRSNVQCVPVMRGVLLQKIDSVVQVHFFLLSITSVSVCLLSFQLGKSIDFYLTRTVLIFLFCFCVCLFFLSSIPTELLQSVVLLLENFNALQQLSRSDDLLLTVSVKSDVAALTLTKCQ